MGSAGEISQDTQKSIQITYPLPVTNRVNRPA